MSLMEVLIHFFITLLILLSIVLISRSVVAGTKYSPILIIVVFGLSLGMIFKVSGLVEPGLAEFPLVGLASSTTVAALVVAFFVGGQKIRNTFFNPKHPKEDDVILNEKEVILGTRGTQLVFIVRSFFLLLGIISLYRIIIGAQDMLTGYYPLIAFFGLAGSVILIDSKAKIVNKRKYINRGIIEFVMIIAILTAAFFISDGIKGFIGLPQIFFAMIISSILGMIFPDWRFGPTMRALLFGGIPLVLAAVFLVGGTRLLEAFSLDGMKQVMAFGFFGQLFWMFVGIWLLAVVGKSNKVEILAPGMAGSLSHSGLTGACTAGDLGDLAKDRAPVMINVPFLGHLFVFTILAAAASQAIGSLLKAQVLIPAIIVILAGIVLTYFSLRVLRRANNEESKEIKGLILFSLGWQLVAVFGGFLLLSIAGMNLENAAMANSAAISHFGLFAAIQGGMFESVDAAVQSSQLILFIFAMPFLIHPVVFG
ncbi:MAG: hypothetical protein R3232_05425, partial [Clostridia bacterium]|nr:hypothetical protein [Clostridia bacterium]